VKERERDRQIEREILDIVEIEPFFNRTPLAKGLGKISQVEKQ
jgi:hypothetical protein